VYAHQCRLTPFIRTDGDEEIDIEREVELYQEIRKSLLFNYSNYGKTPRYFQPRYKKVFQVNQSKIVFPKILPASSKKKGEDIIILK